MLLLSHPLSPLTPAYAGGQGPKIEPENRIEAGDSCNTSTLVISNHHGTHVDCPRHFAPQGKTVTQYSNDFWFCRSILLVSIPLEEGVLCTTELLSRHFQTATTDFSQVEAILLKTGWSQKRRDRIYWEKQPGFEPALAGYLRDHFPKLRFFGFDLLSLSSIVHRPLGRETHRAFLEDERPILILEDLNAEPLEGIDEIHNLFISPLFIENGDGAPCTVWANMPC